MNWKLQPALRWPSGRQNAYNQDLNNAEVTGILEFLR